MTNDKKMSFDEFVAKAESVNSAELMEMITGGNETDCHPGDPNCNASVES
ncbi:hypothetical protein [Niastella vici]|nr:hypothetical protein [Niastella vici]